MGKIKNINNKQNQNEMKPTHLITLSACVKQLKNSRIDYQSHVEAIEDFDVLLDTIITLAHFVPCDANGVPLEKPKKYFACNAREAAEILDYNEAQKSVIFEGWEVVRNEKHRKNIKHLSSKIEIVFENGILPSIEILNAQHNWYPIKIQSLADLAAATTKNPLKLK